MQNREIGAYSQSGAARRPRSYGSEAQPWQEKPHRCITSHAGHGPKNYHRPDERISDDIHRSLTNNPFVDATEIVVDVSDGIVTLSGLVPERYMKYIAEETAADVLGVRDVDNRLRPDPGYRNPAQR